MLGLKWENGTPVRMCKSDTPCYNRGCKGLPEGCCHEAVQTEWLKANAMCVCPPDLRPEVQSQMSLGSETTHPCPVQLLVRPASLVEPDVERPPLQCASLPGAAVPFVSALCWGLHLLSLIRTPVAGFWDPL